MGFEKLWPGRSEAAEPPIFLEWRSSSGFIIFVVVFAVFTVCIGLSTFLHPGMVYANSRGDRISCSMGWWALPPPCMHHACCRWVSDFARRLYQSLRRLYTSESVYQRAKVSSLQSGRVCFLADQCIEQRWTSILLALYGATLLAFSRKSRSCALIVLWTNLPNEQLSPATSPIKSSLAGGHS